MTTRLHLRCDGCDAETHTKPIRKRFVSVRGRSHGFGSWQLPSVDDVVTELGWIWSDPYTSCTYCPTCWAGIEAGKGAEAPSALTGKTEAQEHAEWDALRTLANQSK
jgi:hypothetical protein